MNPIRIYLVDDHQIMREGLRLVLAREPDFTVVGEAADGVAALRQIEAHCPDVAVLDIEMPGLNGLDLAERIRALQPETKVLLLSARAEAPEVHAALRAGVSGFLIKAGATDELVQAIRAIAQGKVYFCGHVSAVLVREFHRTAGLGATPVSMLSARETDVLRRIAEGQTTKEIAFALEVSPKTVESHRANLMVKLGEFSIAALTKCAVRAGLTKL
jgi:DNA-binding NarL/FixJ family response regulator